LSDYGRHLGLAFQIADDLLDEVGEAARVGKVVGKDAKAGKQTYCRVVGVEQARELARRECERAVAALRGFEQEADDLRDLARFVAERDH
jgi:farnesyl diphosphate synthase